MSQPGYGDDDMGDEHQGTGYAQHEDPSHYDPTHVGPSHYDPTHGDLSHYHPPQADPGHADPYSHGGQQQAHGSAPIDERYYHCSGPATTFHQTFDAHICSYEDLFNHFHPTIVQANSPHGDGDQAANMIHEAIQTIAAMLHVEDIVILCMIIQESTGNCYVPTTTDADGEHTGGLMQCSGCEGLDITGGQLTQPLVTNMINAGTQHLKQCLDQQHGNVYEALRMYNSGAIAADEDLSSPHSVGTPSYVNDVANRLHGWISGSN